MPTPLACRPLQANELPHHSIAAAVVHRRLLRSAHPKLRFGPLQPASPTPATSPTSPNGPGWWLQLRIGAVPLVLQAPPSLWPEWSPPVAGRAVPEALVSAGIAHAAAPLWQALAQATGATVQVLRACWMQQAPPPPVQALAWQFGPNGWSGSLHAPTAPAWAGWSTALREPARTPWQSPAADPWRAGALSASLPVPVALELGRTRLPAGDLARMRRHAVLLIDALDGAPATAFAAGRSANQHLVRVLAGRRRQLVAQAGWQAPGHLRRQVLSTAAMTSPPLSLEGIPMSAQADHSSAAAVPTAASTATSTSQDPGTERLDLGAVEVEVRFELARQHWPLAELAQWRIGESLPFDVPFAGATVGAWVHERCVASGRLVVVGDRLGLRIDALNSEAAAAVSQAPSVAAQTPLPPASRPRGRANITPKESEPARADTIPTSSPSSSSSSNTSD